MKSDVRTLRLIAVGASIAANCQPCLQTNIAKALSDGASQAEIAESIQIGRMVRRGAASKMDQFIETLDPTTSPATLADGGCGCVS